MTASWKPLEWDTEFFGIPIGRIDVGDGDPDAIAEAEAEARDAGITCLYASLDPRDYVATYTVQPLGYRFVESAVRFDLGPEVPVAGVADDVRVRRGTEDDLALLDESLVRMASWSRYAVDPRFGTESAVRIHRAWVDRAARCETGERDLRIAEDDRGVLAFATRNRDLHPMIDTIATVAPGSGAAQALVADGQEWARPESIWGGWIASRNIPSTRFVEQCGYRVAEVRYHYHRWLDEG
jgi:hypothetical protein